MKNIFVAFQILTTIPLGIPVSASNDDLTRSVVYFPIVGFCVGLLLVALTYLLVPLLPAGPLAALLILCLVFTTGGLHADGLADLCDGIFSGGRREEMLAVMKDSRIGTFGVLGLITVFLLKYALFVELINRERLFGFLLMGILGRWAMVLAAYIGTYARERGTGQPFIGKISAQQFWGATIIAIVLTSAIQFGAGLIAFSFVFLFVLVFKTFLHSRVGGLTGDALGALNEISETLVLCSVLVSGPIFEFS